MALAYTAAAVVAAVSSFAAVSFLLHRFSPAPPAFVVKRQPESPFALYVGRTVHARYAPVPHNFKYPIFYFGIDLDKLSEASSFFGGKWFSVNKWGTIFTFWEKDHLNSAADYESTKDLPLKERALRILEKLGVPRNEVGKVELITMPKVFGRSFNPLSVYYCFSSTNPTTVRAVLLEVNNTFNERHVYLCDESNRLEATRSGYGSSHKMNRSFHVSPFNNRTGDYEIHVSSPESGSVDVLIIVKDYKADLPGEENPENVLRIEKHLMARVWAEKYPLTGWTMAYLVSAYPITAFLTVPRIMYEAWKLAYQKHLPIYQRPHPYSDVHGQAMTIRRKKMTAFDLFCSDIAFAFLARQCKSHGAELQVILPDETIVVITAHGEIEKRPSPTTASQKVSYGSLALPTTQIVKVHLHSYNLVKRLVLDGDNVARCLAHCFTRGDFSTEHPDNFLRIFLSSSSSTTTQKIDSVSKLRAWFNKDATVPSPFGAIKSSFPNVEIPNTWGAYLTLFRNAVEIRAEEGYFSSIATFALDPNELPSRVVKYVEDAKGRDNGSWKAAEVRPLAEMEDELSPEEREQLRFGIFWESLWVVVDKSER
ncbi:hypothetical protein BJ742DRAFT_855773 [Cladochytrium replicatum]|nr:hypothetical protein BJ742DRAFT_855773 [Cladochytrium replicatum]